MRRDVVETNGQALVGYLKQLPGTLQACAEPACGVIESRESEAFASACGRSPHAADRRSVMPHLELHMEWVKVAAELGWDGSLRDLYVFETSESDWDTFLASLSSWPYEASFMIDGEPSPLPDTAAAAFEIRERAAPILRVNVSGITVCAHFFTRDELELDIDPREVSDPGKLAALSEFICRLGQALGRPVVFTHENRPEHVIARYLPSVDEFTYRSPNANSGAA